MLTYIREGIKRFPIFAVLLGSAASGTGVGLGMPSWADPYLNVFSNMEQCAALAREIEMRREQRKAEKTK